MKKSCVILLLVSILKKTMTPNTQRSTVNTGSSTLRRQSSVSLNVETTQKVSHGLSVPIRTAATNISVLSSLRSRRHARAGIFAQAVTKKGSCCSRNTSQKTYSRSSFGRISNMTGTSSKKLQRSCFPSYTITTSKQ